MGSNVFVDELSIGANGFVPPFFVVFVLVVGAKGSDGAKGSLEPIPVLGRVGIISWVDESNEAMSVEVVLCGGTTKATVTKPKQAATITPAITTSLDMSDPSPVGDKTHFGDNQNHASS
jgi:hypothetical protein